MRISTQQITQNAVRALQDRLTNLASAQDEVTTGRRVNTVSDDPVDAGRIMRLDGSLRELDQYRRNGTAATTRLSAEDSVLSSLRSLLGQARDLALKAASDDPADPTRLAALAAVNQIKDQVIGLGNTRVGNEYIFGGGQSTVAPFINTTGAYVGDSLVRQAAIDTGVTVDLNHTGDQILQPALQALDALRTELQTGTAASIQASANGVNAAEDQALAGQSIIGLRLQQVQDTGADVARRSGMLIDQRNAIRDADPTTSVVKLMDSQSALERAYAALGRVLNTNLLDYLR